MAAFFRGCEISCIGRRRTGLRPHPIAANADQRLHWLFGQNAASTDYIATFPAGVQKRLRLIRRAIRKAAPAAEVKISYRIPAFTLGGNLIYFAAFRNPIGVYPGAAAIASMKADLAGYRTAKGTVQLPMNQPLPLIEKLVRFKFDHNSRHAKR